MKSKMQAGGKKRSNNKKGTKKRKMNEYFKRMTNARKSGAESFKYRGKTYKRNVSKKNPEMVFYKKA